MSSQNVDLPARQMGSRELVSLMAMTMALQSLAIDAMLPALGEIGRELHVATPNQRQLVVGVYVIAAGLGALVPGLLADRFGRRPVLLGCLALYVALALGCALAPDFHVLLVLRVLQAFAGGGFVVLPYAIIRDRHGGDGMAKMMSTVTVVFMLAPMLAPALGQTVLLFAGWRWIFAVMGIMGAMVGCWATLRLPETLHPEYRQSILPMTIARNMALVVINREAIGYMIGGALVTGTLFGYISCSQQLIGEHFGAGKLFPLVFAGTATSLGLANFFNSRIVERFGARRVSQTALLIFIGLSIIQLILASSDNETLWQFFVIMTLNICMAGFIGVNFNAIMLQPFARMAGAASSVQNFVRITAGAVIGVLIGQAFDGTALPLAQGFLASGIMSLAAVLYSEKGKLFRRLYPAGTPRPGSGI